MVGWKGKGRVFCERGEAVCGERDASGVVCWYVVVCGM